MPTLGLVAGAVLIAGLAGSPAAADPGCLTRVGVHMSDLDGDVAAGAGTAPSSAPDAAAELVPGLPPDTAGDTDAADADTSDDTAADADTSDETAGDTDTSDDTQATPPVPSEPVSGTSELSLDATAHPMVVTPGEVVVVTITVTNSGDGASLPVSVSQALPEGAVPAAPVDGLDPRTGVLELDSLAPGETVTVRIPLTVPEARGAVLTMPNLNGTEEGDYPFNDQACTVLTVVDDGEDPAPDDVPGGATDVPEPAYTGGPGSSRSPVPSGPTTAPEPVPSPGAGGEPTGTASGSRPGSPEPAGAAAGGGPRAAPDHAAPPSASPSGVAPAQSATRSMSPRSPRSSATSTKPAPARSLTPSTSTRPSATPGPPEQTGSPNQTGSPDQTGPAATQPANAATTEPTDESSTEPSADPTTGPPPAPAPATDAMSADSDVGPTSGGTALTLLGWLLLAAGCALLGLAGLRGRRRTD